MQEIKQSTEVKVRIGAAVDATDGVTPETTLALGAADQAELLKHNGVATVDIAARTFAAVTACDGWYDLTLTTADTGTLGMLTVVIQDSSLMAPIFKDFMVTTANYWDSKYSTDTLQVDLTQIGGVTQSATDLKDFVDTGYDPALHRAYVDIKRVNGETQAAVDLCDFINNGYDPATNKITGCKVNDDMVGTDNAALATGVDVTSIHGSVLTETVGGYLAAGFTKLFDVATPVLVASEVMRGTDGANTTVPDAAGVAPTAVDIKAEAVAALADIKLDHLVNSAVDTNWATTVHLDSVIGHIADVGTTATFSRTTDALEAIRDRGDAEWVTATGFNVVIPDIAGTAEGLHNTTNGAISTVDGNVDSILVDTGTTLPARFTGLEGATFNTATDSNEAIRNRGDDEWVTATTAALSAQGKLDVNVEVADVIRTDVTAEMAQGPPPATPTMEEMMAYIYFSLRNKTETTASENAVYNNAGTTKLFKTTISDNGTTFVKAEYVSGV